jgi:hypothetical protein
MEGAACALDAPGGQKLARLAGGLVLQIISETENFFYY